MFKKIACCTCGVLRKTNTRRCFRSLSRNGIGTSSSTIGKNTFATNSALNTQHEDNETTDTTSAYASDPPYRPDRDWIGPVDKRSNLRQVRFAQSEDETETERIYRTMREEIYVWNNAFWARHNQNFIEAKEQFVERAMSRKGVGLLDEDGAKRVLSADEMAEFYKEFLQDHQQTLGRYNRDWYRRNTALLWPAFKVAVQRLMR